MNGERVCARPDYGHDVIEHDEAERLGAVGELRRGAELHVRRAFDRFLEETIALGNEQHFHRHRHEADDGRLVVHGEKVRRGQAHGEDAVVRLRGREDDELGVGAADVERTRLHELAVEEQLDIELGGVGGVVRDAGEDRALSGVLRIRARVEPHDACVVAFRTDAVINERQIFVREFFEIGRSAIAEEMNLAGGHGFLAALLERKRARRLERISQTRRRIGCGARLQRAAERGLVRGRRLLHLGRCASE